MLSSTRLKLLFIFVFPQFIHANVSLNSLFSDHMVVQRETKIPVWGWADPNEKIFIESSWGAKAATVANEDGTWSVLLKTPEAGGPFTFTVSGNNTIKINDVLSGEVWLCAGQSNMDFAMSKFVNDARESKYQPLVEYIRNEVETVDDNWIRHIEVPKETSLYKQKKNFKGAWVSANPQGIKKITATGYFFAKELRKKLNVPIGLVECSWSGTRIQPWISKEAYLSNKNLKAFFQENSLELEETIKNMDADDYVDHIYEQKLLTWNANGKKGKKPKAAEHPKKSNKTPTTLYNGMLSAIIPFKIKGAIWYQGESNAVYKSKEYEEYLSTLITSWRSAWGQGDFSFYWTQLAGCKRGDPKSDEGWATVNNQLRKSMKLHNTGMAVLHDIGEEKDIHPHNKMDVGKRLSLWALEKDYGVELNAVSGPLYDSYKSKKGRIKVEFSNVGSGLMLGRKNLLNDVVPVNSCLNWFEIAGEDGEWKKAGAMIVSKNKIEVWNSSIPNPKHVRYAWSGNPKGANLYNNEGLPAAVFSTKDREE